ncbi:GTP cyclohydrolase II [Vibrio phage VPT02]|uniref:NADAR domain-containing protein n=1 Tax=Vibrio phage pVp-1 TaxID=1150989 RepID=H6WXD1_9CAUD|nr:hypothetical protein F404_gp040 [Vibrio phage pVp-1]AFB83897.1 hypothetical protein pVp-1_0040 [Vibrio phage pVp-1]QIG60680.1 GTP cyclohydrolase II [Vibrio phage VPT02]
MKVIDSFRGEHAFLSNMFPVVIEHDGITYPSSENLYQAFKTPERRERKLIAKLPPNQSKNYWKFNAIKTPNFHKDKLKYMEIALRAKFEDPYLAAALIMGTKDAELIEGNWWGDGFWGVSDKTGHGHNHLGKLLMKIREELNGRTEG